MSLILPADSVSVSRAAAPLEIFSRGSDAASRVTNLTWFLIILAALVYVAVMVVMLWAVRRNRDRDPLLVDVSDRPTRGVTMGGLVLPGIVLFAVFIVSETAMGHTGDPDHAPLTVHVTAHQWWWEVTYELPDLSSSFKTANEIHVPVGAEVRVLLTSGDVIHSFWVPRLQGKLDVNPGDTNDLRLRASVPGTYWGTCAEFCGSQHANMRLQVVAEDEPSFRAWLSAQEAPAVEPTDAASTLGKQLFVAGPCAMCHTVRGTDALGQVAPDLTHVGSRQMIAAGTLPNTLGNLEAWITNAQSIKPGAKMPNITTYTGAELRAVAEYVASLK